MTTPQPPYVVHVVDEQDVTVDWFFRPRQPGAPAGTRLKQLVLVVVGWFFVVLPVVITTSALLHRDDDSEGWWGYHEGFVMWDLTMILLGILFVAFVVGFLALHLIDRASTRRRDQRFTFDEERLERRLEVADAWYAGKFGPESIRVQQSRIRIEPYADLETYELRGLYRAHGVDQ